jgi:hypothetical protein
MRVVRTEIYLDPPPIGDVSPLAKSISFAWFKDEDADGAALDLATLFRPEFSIVTVTDDKQREKEALKFVLSCLMQGAPDVENRAAATWLDEKELLSSYATEVVIEQSPPVALPLSKIISKSPGIAIGTFIGYQVGAENAYLMFLSIPGGILAVSSAIGIARALEQGLHRKVEALFKSKPKRAQTM